MDKLNPRRSSPPPAIDARLDALVAELTAGQTPIAQDISTIRIYANPYQTKKTYTGPDELVATMVKHGFPGRLRVRQHPRVPGGFQLLYGERWLRAAVGARMLRVPCDVVVVGDDVLVETALLELVLCGNLDPLAEGQAFQRLINARGYSLRTLAARLGKHKGYVENRVNLLKMPSDVQQLVATRPDTLIAAREIARLDDPYQRDDLIVALLDRTRTLVQVRAQVARLLAAPEEGRRRVDDTDEAELLASPPILSALAPDAGMPVVDLTADMRVIARVLARWRALAEHEAARPLLEAAIAQIKAELARIA